MAKKTITTLTDDLDGSQASGTSRFSLDGSDYEIDLNDENTAALTGILDRYIDGARNAGAPRGRAPRTRPAKGGEAPDAKAVRAWAAEHSIEVNARGRLRPEIVEQYRTAHPG